MATKYRIKMEYFLPHIQTFNLWAESMEQAEKFCEEELKTRNPRAQGFSALESNILPK